MTKTTTNVLHPRWPSTVTLRIWVLAGALTACADGDDVSDATDQDSDEPVLESPFDMVEVPAGTFTMGITEEDGGEPGWAPHEVTLTYTFRISKYEVRSSDFAYFDVADPSEDTSCGAECPVENVTWLDAVAFANEASRQVGLTPCYDLTASDATLVTGVECEGFRLPTEAEWELAASAPRDATYSGGDAPDAVAWTSANSGGTKHAAGSKAPNDRGLYDMSGNVSEWCWDWYDAYPTDPQTDPLGPASGFAKTNRGGDWSRPVVYAETSIRGVTPPDGASADTGFRLVQTVQ